VEPPRWIIWDLTAKFGRFFVKKLGFIMETMPEVASTQEMISNLRRQEAIGEGRLARAKKTFESVSELGELSPDPVFLAKLATELIRLDRLLGEHEINTSPEVFRNISEETWGKTPPPPEVLAQYKEYTEAKVAQILKNHGVINEN